MKESYPGQFENFPNEKNVFAIAEREMYSPEYQSAYTAIMHIVQRIIRDVLSIDQKRILLLFLNDNSLFDISRMLQVNNSTIHQNYNLVIKKISVALLGDQEFLVAVEKTPEYLKNKLRVWMSEVKEKYNLVKYICPICEQFFDSKFFLKKHVTNQNDKNHIKYYRQQIRFVKKQLNKHGFAVAWIYKSNNDVLFSMSWIWNYWKKHYGKNKLKETICKILRRQK